MFLAAATINGFAYPLSSGAASDAKPAAYALPDGVLPALCLSPGSDQEPDVAQEHCDACRLVSAPLLGLVAGDMAGLPVVYTSVGYESETGPIALATVGADQSPACTAIPLSGLSERRAA